MYQLLMTAITYGEDDVYLPLLKMAPRKLLKNFDSAGSNVAHYLARSNCQAGIKWVHQHYPEFLTQKNSKQHTPFYIALKNNHQDVITYLEKFNLKGPSFSLASNSLVAVKRPESLAIVLEDEDILNYAVKGDLAQLRRTLNRQSFNRNKARIVDSIVTNQHPHCVGVLASFLSLNNFIEMLGNTLIYYPKKRSNIALIRFIELEYDHSGEVLRDIIDHWPDNSDDKNEQRKKIIEIASKNYCEKIIKDMYAHVSFENEKETADFFGTLFDNAAIRQYQCQLKKDVSHLTAPDFTIPVINVVAEVLASEPKTLALVLDKRLEMGDETAIHCILLKLSIEQKKAIFKQSVNDDMDFNTLIHHAISLNNAQAVICMLDNGASLQIKNRRGRAAEDVVNDLLAHSKLAKSLKDKETRSMLLRLQIYNKILNLIETDYTFDEKSTKGLVKSINNLSKASVNNMTVISKSDAIEDLFALGQRGLENAASEQFFQKLFDIIRELESGKKFKQESCYIYMINLAVYLKDYDEALKQANSLEKYLQVSMRKEDPNKPLLLTQLKITKISLQLYKSFNLQMPEPFRRIIKKDLFSPNGMMIFPVVFIPHQEKIFISLEQLNALNQFLECLEQSPAQIEETSGASDYRFLTLSALCVQAGLTSIHSWLTQLLDNIHIDGMMPNKNLKEITVTEKNIDAVNQTVKLYYMKSLILGQLLNVNKVLGYYSSHHQIDVSLSEKIVQEKEDAKKLAEYQIDFSQLFDEEPSPRKAKKKKKRNNGSIHLNGSSRTTQDESDILKIGQEKEEETGIDSLKNFMQHEESSSDLGLWKKVGKKKTMPVRNGRFESNRPSIKTFKQGLFQSKKMNYSLNLRYMSKNKVLHAPFQITLPLEIYDFMRTFKQGEIFLTGGFPRDKLCGRDFNDIDFVVVGRSIDDLSTLFYKSKYEAEVHGHGRNKSLKIKVGGFDVDLTSASDSKADNNRSVITMLRDNAGRRDFTCNSLFIGLEGNNGCLYDFFNGVRDLLERKSLVAVPSKDNVFVFTRYPLRLLRALVLLNTMNLSFSKTFQNKLNVNREDMINALYSVTDTRFEEFYNKMTGLFGYEKTHESLTDQGLLKQVFAKRIFVVIKEKWDKVLYSDVVRGVSPDGSVSENKEEATSVASPKL